MERNLPSLAVILTPLLIGFYLVSREPIRISAVEFELQETGSRLSRDSALRWLVVVYSLLVMANSGVISFLPAFLVEVHGFLFAFASSAFALIYAIGLLAKPISGFLSDRISRASIADSGLIVVSGGLAMLATAPVEPVAIGGIVVYALGQRGVPPAL